jgi:hypothetical protein
MSLLDEIHDLQRKYEASGRYERMALDLAASLLEEIHETINGDPPPSVTMWTEADYKDLPEVWELVDGRVVPKRWKMWADLDVAEAE